MRLFGQNNLYSKKESEATVRFRAQLPGFLCLSRTNSEWSRKPWQRESSEPLAVLRRRERADKSDALQTLRDCRRHWTARSVGSACVFSAAFPRQSAIRGPGRLPRMETYR